LALKERSFVIVEPEVLNKISDMQFGTYMLVFGMGLTLITLYILTWFMRALTAIFKDKEEKEDVLEKG